MSATSCVKSRLWGILTQKERWGLSGRGWLVFASALLLGIWALLANIQPFLAVTDRADAHFLVVEGWVHEYAIRAGAAEFRTGAYQRVFATGGPVTGTGSYTSDYTTSAHVGADQLRNAGVPPEAVEMVPSRVMDRDRTYSSAVALRDWFRQHNMSVSSINVVTENVHARRTRLLFQKAFGGDVRVGVIAVPNPDYEPGHWWRYSEGVKDVLSEAIAYIYARLFFHPSN
jgi:uncharacterized SAM-binding protein YcdF (DUF218 family)